MLKYTCICLCLYNSYSSQVGSSCFICIFSFIETNVVYSDYMYFFLFFFFRLFFVFQFVYPFNYCLDSICKRITYKKIFYSSNSIVFYQCQFARISVKSFNRMTLADVLSICVCNFKTYFNYHQHL